MQQSEPRRTRQAGFTMIELVIVIIILGVLAAVAVPRFMDLGEDAENAARNAQAASLRTANTLNQAACAGVGDADCIDEIACDDETAEALVDGFDTNQFALAGAGGEDDIGLVTLTDDDGDSIDCQVNPVTN